MESILQTNMEPIRFYSGDENGVVIEKKDYDNSIFVNQYKQGLRLMDELSHRIKHSDGVSYPNIIAFCGDRGEGKTSCMLSVKEIIQKEDDELIKSLIGDSQLNPKIYDFLPMIEPAFFDREHNILELVIGQLFAIFKEQNEILKSKNLFDVEKQRKVLKRFNKVKKCITLLIANDSNLYDAIEELDELAASMSLRTEMNSLIDAYLDYVGKEMLVIMIDDMDYNWEEAYDMTKMLSKYLGGEQCIIMVSVSIQQLIDVTKTSFENDINHRDTTIVFDKIASKYINKLIPLHYRVEMPKVTDMSERKLIIVDNMGTEKSLGSVKHTMVQLIFDKTRYLFYNSELNVSMIVPDDLRSLRHLLGLLLSMDDYDKSSDDKEVKARNLENKRTFTSYLYHTWSQQLKKKDREFVQRLVYNDQSTVNKLVVQYLKTYIETHQMSEGLYKDILSPANYSYNISIGDVFYVMNYIERNAIDRESKLLVFFLKSYYSIMLYTYYDDITKDIDALHPVRVNRDDEIFRMDSWFYTTNSLQGIVNGSYFTYQPSELLRPTIQGEEAASDLVCMDSLQFNALLSDIRNNMDRYPTMTEVTKRDFEQSFRLVELFMLSISRRSYQKDKGEVQIERSRPNPYYVESFGEDVYYYVYDILAPFVNLINVKFTYDRFAPMGGNLYNFALAHEWSLLRKMMAKVVEDDRSEKKDALDYQEMRLVSDAVIRNAEILTMLKEKLESLDNTTIYEDAPGRFIAAFYRLLRNNIGIKTYEKMADGKYKAIKYRFLQVIENELDLCNQALFGSLLLSYTEQEIKEKKTKSFDNKMEVGEISSQGDIIDEHPEGSH